MAHVYASLTEFKNFLRENGSSSLGTNNDAEMLSILDSVSRRIDEWTGRGSGFGPVTATRYFDGSADNTLWLEADLATASPTVTISQTTGAAGTSATVTTDYYLQRGNGSYGDPPYRRILLHGAGAFTTFGTGRRTTAVGTSWGYPSITRTLTATTTEALDNSETGIDVSAITEFSAGQTLVIESEQVYVTAASTLTVTADRGVNGTTAASHLTGLAIGRVIYDSAVVDACKRVALRRWRARDAGADGIDGGGQVGTITPREGEDLILARAVGHLRIEPGAR